MSPRRRFLLILLVAAGIGGLLYWLIETDRQKIEKLIDRARLAAAKGDAQGVMAEVDPAYDHKGQTFAALRAEVEGALARYRPERVQLYNPSLTLKDDAAQYETSVVIVPSASSQLPSTAKFEVSLGLKKKDGRWFIVSVDEGE